MLGCSTSGRDVNVRTKETASDVFFLTGRDVNPGEEWVDPGAAILDPPPIPRPRQCGLSV